MGKITKIKRVFAVFFCGVILCQSAVPEKACADCAKNTAVVGGVVAVLTAVGGLVTGIIGTVFGSEAKGIIPTLESREQAKKDKDPCGIGCAMPLEYPGGCKIDTSCTADKCNGYAFLRNKGATDTGAQEGYCYPTIPSDILTTPKAVGGCGDACKSVGACSVVRRDGYLLCPMAGINGCGAGGENPFTVGFGNFGDETYSCPALRTTLVPAFINCRTDRYCVVGEDLA